MKMKLYLSSYHIPNPQAFSEFVGKDLSSIKLGLIFNAKDHKTKEERVQKLAETIEYMSALGIKVEEVNLLDYIDKPEELLRKFKEFDILWFNGGNTYCLRWALAKSKSEEILREALESGVIYGGDSAGSIIVGPTLKYYDVADDPTRAPEAIYEGLNWVDVAVLPHWGSEEFGPVLGSIEDKLKADGYQTERLTDDEYLMFENGKRVEQ